MNVFDEILQIGFEHRGKSGLDRLRALMPKTSFQIIHVAGTNGKGSVSTKVAWGLQQSGHLVGLFTSPHLDHYSERIRVNGHCISEEAIGPLFQKYNAFRLSYFELSLLMALEHFENEGVDFAVIEAGIGGELDSTNIVNSSLSIITSIGFDHQEILGSTLEEIARAKAGILRKNRPVVLGTNQRVILERAKNLGSPITVELGGNEAIAKRALEQFGIEGSDLSVELPCRMEWVGERLLFDVAHNQDAFHYLFEKVGRPEQMIFAFSKGKDLESCQDILEGIEIFLPNIDHPRLMSPLEIQKVLPWAKRTPIPREWEGLRICTGSFYAMRWFRDHLAPIAPTREMGTHRLLQPQ